MEFNKKYKIITCIDGGIVFLSNVIVVLVSSLFPNPRKSNQETLNWLNFLDAHSSYIITEQIVSFLVPLLLIAVYADCCSNESKKIRLSSFPLVFSIMGISGWITNIIIELLFVAQASSQVQINSMLIISSSLFYTILASLFTFTISFFTTETLHRKIFLPKVFPQGHIPSKKSLFRPSVRMVSTIFYIATAIFPIIYLFACYIITCRNHSVKIHWENLEILGILIFIGFFLKMLFTAYISAPIKKLIEGTKRIKNGDFNSQIDFVSGDDFGELTDTFNDMAYSIRTKSEKILAIQNSIIKGMAVMVESRDNSTGGHINRTSECVKVFSRHLIDNSIFPEIPELFYENLAKAAPMHDLGKIAVDDAILRKNGKFTDEEYEKMKKHSEEGARIVRHVLKEIDDDDFKKIAINVAHFHHEKWDGSGYPTKISGEQIPLEARIMALADVFDALVSKRCYKEEFSYEKAFGIIENSLSSHFDPILGREFLKCRAKLELLYNTLSE